MIKKALPLVAALAAYAAIYAAFSWWRTGAASANPHAFMKDPAHCADCHMEARPEPGRPYATMNFRKDIYSLCVSCHPMHTYHPVEIAPGRERGKALPLDIDGAMTCITCHAPHAPAHGDTLYTGRTLFEKLRDVAFPYLPGKYRTYFLRMPTSAGELCESCHSIRNMKERIDVVRVDPAKYAGARACAGCHPGQFRMWEKTPHARMMRNPRLSPDAVLAKFSDSPPLLSSEIAYVLGSRNVQRFISRKGNDLVVRTPIWLVRSKQWNLKYWREMNWLKSCAGCHTTGFDPNLGTFAEKGISCEACHGPGKRHAATGNSGDIVHPGKIPEARRAMICESCHTAGHDMTGEFSYPVGFVPGADLRQYFQGLTPRPGQDDRSFKGDGSYTDRHSQYLFWRSRMLLMEGETCDLCRNFRVGRTEASGNGTKTMTAQEFCLSCHDGTIVPLPREHSSKAMGGAACLSCHPPARTVNGETTVHDHRYIPAEALAKNDYLPAPDFRSICFRCHPSPGKETERS
ncbi:MAG: hypothetical protein HY896_05010 [Deltaproteobacteria bacterium]|nr:hypothetical protein [Deltaproteobacteria bacterium]